MQELSVQVLQDLFPMSVASKTKPLSCIQVLCDHNSICNGFQRASEFDTHLAIFGAILTLLRTSSCESIYAPRHTSFQLKQISRAICTIPKSILLVDCQLPYNRYTRFRAENLIAVKTMIFFFTVALNILPAVPPIERQWLLKDWSS